MLKDNLLIASDKENEKNLIIINLENHETIISKQNILDGEKIDFILVHEKNKCVVIMSEGLKKVCLIDYKGKKLTKSPKIPFLIITKMNHGLIIMN